MCAKNETNDRDNTKKPQRQNRPSRMNREHAVIIIIIIITIPIILIMPRWTPQMNWLRLPRNRLTRIHIRHTHSHNQSTSPHPCQKQFSKQRASRRGYWNTRTSGPAAALLSFHQFCSGKKAIFLRQPVFGLAWLCFFGGRHHQAAQTVALCVARCTKLYYRVWSIRYTSWVLMGVSVSVSMGWVCWIWLVYITLWYIFMNNKYEVA